MAQYLSSSHTRHFVSQMEGTEELLVAYPEVSRLGETGGIKRDQCVLIRKSRTNRTVPPYSVPGGHGSSRNGAGDIHAQAANMNWPEPVRNSIKNRKMKVSHRNRHCGAMNNPAFP